MVWGDEGEGRGCCPGLRGFCGGLCTSEVHKSPESPSGGVELGGVAGDRAAAVAYAYRNDLAGPE